MNVFEFIKEKRSGIKDNTEQYRAILEPKFRSLSNKINNKNSFNDEYPTLNDGLRGMLFIEKAVESHSKGNIWVNLNSN